MYSREISAGLSVTKVLAKVASKHRKPSGFTVIPGRAIAAYLETLPAEKSGGSARLCAKEFEVGRGLVNGIEIFQNPPRLAAGSFTRMNQ